MKNTYDTQHIHITRYDVVGNPIPPNGDEIRNSGYLKRCADFELEWITVGDDSHAIDRMVNEWLSAHEDLTRWLDEQ
jgi:hypothetical protein